MTPDLLFVYGTLRRGFDHPMARHLADNSDYRGEATCRGRLYDLGSYPGLTPSEDDADIVHGDLYRLRGDDLLTALDAYEGCGPHDAPPTPYVRDVIGVVRADDTHDRAWTYLYRLPVAAAQRIASGRFTAP